MPSSTSSSKESTPLDRADGAGSHNPLGRFAVRAVCFLAVLGIVAVALEFSNLPLRILEPRLVEILAAKKSNADVVWFGSSVNRYVDPDDGDKRSLDRMVDDELSALRVAGISQGSLDGDNFESYAAYLVKKDYLPKVVVFPVNLRSFSVSWHKRPEFQLHREKMIARGPVLWQQFVAVMGEGGERLSQTEYLRFPYRFRGQVRTLEANEAANQSVIERGDANAIEASEMRTGFINHYLYDLDGSHPNLVALANAGKVLRQAEVGVVFYITPVDVVTGARFVDELAETVEANVSVIRTALEPYGDVVDLSRELGAQSFSYEIRPNEHLNEAGRQFVAETVAGTVAEVADR